ncbi:hypothetical protein [Streptomyces fradiae]|uniref:hypothetical protein n=1 Tax=Streptomyces fradiae TaxID=1906 RepID=UPI0037011BA3
MTPRTRSRLQAAAQQLAGPPPVHLRGQTTIPLTWQQDALWDEPAPPTRPSLPPRRTTAALRRRQHWFDSTARPATRHRASYTLGRRIVDIAPAGTYL